MAERVLVLGASGFVGAYLMPVLMKPGRQLIGTCHREKIASLQQLDLRRADQLRQMLEQARPDLVVFAAGSKDVELCERDPLHAIDANIQAMRNYVESCAALCLTPVTLYFSTDYVFAGTSGYYRSDDQIGPRTNYGLTKAMAEKMLLRSGLTGVILRISAVMGRKAGFFRWLDESLDEGKALSLYDNSFFSPTSIGRVIRFVTDFAEQCGDPAATAPMKIIHLNDGVRLSRYQFGQIVARLRGKSPALITASRADFGATNLHADLSMIPDGQTAFCDEAAWTTLESIV